MVIRLAASMLVFALVASGWAASGEPAPGTPAPAFRLPDQAGRHYRDVDRDTHSKQVLADLKTLQAVARPGH